MPIERHEENLKSPVNCPTPSATSDEIHNAPLISKYSEELENILVEFFGASGNDLHEKISSVEHTLPQQMKTKLRAVATNGNKEANQKNFKAPDSTAHEKLCCEALKELRALSGEGGWNLVGFIYIAISGLAGLSIGIRNFGLTAGIGFALAFMLFCAWILWPKTLRLAFRN